MTKISPRHAATRRIAGSFPNPLDLSRPEPCAPDTAASLRTAYDAAWEAANAAWDEIPGEEPALADEATLIAELETILGRAEVDEETTDSTAIAVLAAAPVDFGDMPRPPTRQRLPLIGQPATSGDDAEAFSNLRHIPEATRTSLAMVLDAAPRRAPRHVHRTQPAVANDTAPPVSQRARRKRKPVLGTIAIAVVLLGGVAGAVLFLDESGTPASQQTAGTDIPWIRAGTGVPNTLVARPAAVPAETAGAAAPATPDVGAVTAAVPLAEKADERVPQTDAVPPVLADDVRVVTTQPVTTGVPAAGDPPATPAEPAAAAPTGVTATTWVNMRAGAGADEAVVAVVEPGAQVEVIGCENWCEVVVNGQRGFIYNEYLAGLR